MSDSNHWDVLWDYMDARMLWCEKVVPHLLCSIGAHVANLRQQEHVRFHNTEDDARDPFWFVLGEPEALGLATLIVSPSGFMKTYPMKILLGTKNNPGLLPFRTGWGGMITEAGFVGTVFTSDGEPIMRPGMAWDYREGIVAFDEASNLLSKDKVDNNVDLVNAVIKAIGDSFVTKRLSGGELDYWTCVTLWLATQPKRLYMVGGLNRRVLKAVPGWKKKHVEELKLARRDRGRDGRWDPADKDSIRLSLDRLVDEFDPDEVIVTDKTEDWLDKHTKNHFEKALMERALVGKKVLTYGSDSILTIDLERDDITMLKSFLHDQKMIEMGAGIQLVYQTLPDEGGMKQAELWSQFQTFSDDFDSFKESVIEAKKREIIKTVVDGAGNRLLARA